MLSDLKLAGEGKQANLGNSEQKAPAGTVLQRNAHDTEEEARRPETVRRSTRIADRGKKSDYAEYPRYDPLGDWSQPYGRGEGVAIA